MPESHIEVITFSKGLNTSATPLMLQDGELVSSSGIIYDTEGAVISRPEKTAVNTSPLTSIHTLHRNLNCLMAGNTQYAHYKWDMNGFCGVYTPEDENFTSAPWRMRNTKKWRITDYSGFAFISNGMDRYAFDAGRWYHWGVDAPTSAPIGAAGAAGNPSGTYLLYYTYVVRFPSGLVVETAPSSAGTVAVTAQAISWSGITPCPFSGSFGAVRHRKLYRYSTGLGETYYVTTLTNNTATTYTDDFSDATLQGNDILETDGYTPPPDGLVDTCLHLSRVFGIKDNQLWYSEPYMPFTFQSSNYIDVFPEGVDCVACVEWGDQVWIANGATWKRLQGMAASSWQLRNTYSTVGTINRNSVCVTKYGIICQWYDGIYIFNGTNARKITESIANSFFTALTDMNACYATWDEPYYRFFTGTTQLILDMRAYPKAVRLLTDASWIPTAYERDTVHGINYWGKSNGYQYEDAGTETIAMSLQTGDRGMKNIFQMKYPKRIYYDINTGGVDVTATLYCDGTAQTALTLNTASRTIDRVDLPLCQGYRFSLALSCASFADVTVYEPWGIEYDYTGV